MTQEEIKDMMLYGERINVEYKEGIMSLISSCVISILYWRL